MTTINPEIPTLPDTEAIVKAQAQASLYRKLYYKTNALIGLFKRYPGKMNTYLHLRHLIRPELSEEALSDIRKVSEPDANVLLDKELHDCIYGKNIPSVVYFIRYYRKLIEVAQISNKKEWESTEPNLAGYYFAERVIRSAFKEALHRLKQDNNDNLLESVVRSYIALYLQIQANTESMVGLLDDLEKAILNNKEIGKKSFIVEESDLNESLKQNKIEDEAIQDKSIPILIALLIKDLKDLLAASNSNSLQKRFTEYYLYCLSRKTTHSEYWKELSLIGTLGLRSDLSRVIYKENNL